MKYIGICEWFVIMLDGYKKGAGKVSPSGPFLKSWFASYD
jgi:hypothetical protein